MQNKYCLLSLAVLALGINAFNTTELIVNKISLAASQTNETTVSQQEKIVASLRDLVTVSVTSVETITYEDEDLTYLNSTNTSSIKRDYGYIVEEDGSHTEAVRFIEDAGATTYFKGEDNSAYYETLTAKNEVVTNVVTSVGMPIAYERNFRNPWKFIDASDISDSLELDTHKASLLLETYLGVERGVAKAKINVDDQGLPVSIDLTIADLPNGYTTATGLTNIISHMETTIEYTYGETDLRHLSPSTTSNPDLDAAINNLGSNFTIAMSSSLLAQPIVMYVTDDYVYIHLSNQKSLVTGDYLFRYEANMRRYSQFLYNESSNSWTRSGYTEGLPFFPGLFTGSISTALFDEVTPGIYALKKDATAVGAFNLAMPVVSGFEELGLAGYVKVTDEHITTLSSTYNYVGTAVTLTVSITDYGTTELPGYVDTNSL